jgi:hypothetical protein
MKSNKIIAIEGATRIELAKLFKVTDKTVFNALSFKSSTSGVQRRIRKAAMERGGRLLVDLTGLETFHDFDGRMRQYLPNGSYIEVCRADNTGHIYFNGKEVARYDKVIVPATIYAMQEKALTLK